MILAPLSSSPLRSVNFIQMTPWREEAGWKTMRFRFHLQKAINGVKGLRLLPHRVCTRRQSISVEKAELKDPHQPTGGALINLISHFVCNLSPWQDLMLFQPQRVMLNHFKVIKGRRIPSPRGITPPKKEMSICYCSTSTPVPPASPLCPTPPLSHPLFPTFILLPFITAELQTCLLRTGAVEVGRVDFILPPLSLLNFSLWSLLKQCSWRL